MAMCNVQYDNLDNDKKTIRILHLLPGRWTESICCRLQTCSLDDSHSFDALSYVWGNAHDTAPIDVGGSSFQATKNLIAALRRLRSSVEPRALWVDAICINQRDNSEKTQQVQLMARIYETARSVHVFLGESGILDLIPYVDQQAWDDPPRIEWHRDDTMMCETEHLPSKVGVGSRGIVTDMAEAVFAPGPDSPDYDPIDPLDLPMWIVVEPKEGIQEQDRMESFFARQEDAETGSVVKSPLQQLREHQEGAFAIMKMLSNGRCPKSCLRAAADSPAWVGALNVIHHISSLPWWARVWIIQETILPKNEVMVIYGEIVAPISLLEVSGAISPRHYERGICCRAFWDSLPPDQKTSFDAYSQVTSRFESIRVNLGNMKQDQWIDRLRFLLEKTRFNDATDPRDKVYALLGLIENSDSDPVDLIPDYNRPPKDVFTDVAMRLISNNRSLIVILNHELGKTALNDTGLGMPSWVPHWGKTYGIVPPHRLNQRLSLYNAWPPGPGKLPELISKTALLVTARRIDRISAVTSAIDKASTPDLGQTLTTLYEFFGGTTSQGNTPPPPPPKYYRGKSKPRTLLSDAIWRTLLGDQISEIDHSFLSGGLRFRRATGADGAFFRMAHLAMITPVVGNVFFIRARDLGSGDGGVVLFSEEQVEKVVRDAEQNFWYASDGKVFFKTETGFIGSGPPETKVGDGVWIVQGSLVPLVLREAECEGWEGVDGACYQLVGYAYVDGIMDGEAAPKASWKDGIRKVLKRERKNAPRQIHLA
ncbi:heterokaryon incompatibility protein-domain-containing protein [Podospora didyma]|uniref:Heterokaryon incompatibility protein-domain-containing protein n=1 Tax=Podospora didyma TaxID=330526 RepID=A0AAE0NS27_9PEZI|nr:heterokaryon incompatibility protein-domain-containing protein [Podospora didyma]